MQAVDSLGHMIVAFSMSHMTCCGAQGFSTSGVLLRHITPYWLCLCWLSVARSGKQQQYAAFAKVQLILAREGTGKRRSRR